MPNRLFSLLLVGSALALTACTRNPLLVSRSPCPAVAIPANTGSMTLFDPPQSRDADAIDLTATLVNLDSHCADEGERLQTTLSFRVAAQRRDTREARDVYLPLFVAMAQGGDVLVSKQQTGVSLHFDAGSARAEAAGGATAEVARASVTLPAEVQERITRKRRPGDRDSLVDPMSDPKVKAAVRAASFEVLVGFQLDDPSLAYNVAR